MANVLKYLTGALSKRAKRKGNLAVGIGEENYGPSSTTGYYAGVTPPEDGFVVYTLGLNNNPKAFYAETEDDLPAIARTLGGGVLDVLGAKNYIVGLANTWILDSTPKNEISDGLVLDLNAKNISSYPGTGNTWYDLSGKGYNASKNGNPTYNSNGWWEFRNTNTDGDFEYFTLSFDEGVLKSTNTTGEWTLETLWRDMGSAYGNENIIIGRWGHHGGILQKTSGGYVYGQIRTNAGGTGQIHTGNTATTDGKWMHIVLTYNNRTARFYINGELVDTDSMSTSYTVYGHNNTMAIGGYPNNNYRAYADIAKVKAYNKELSQAEINQNYYGGNLVTNNLYAAFDPTNLVSYGSGSSQIYNLADVPNTNHDGNVHSAIEVSNVGNLKFGGTRYTNVYHSQDFDFPGWNGYSVGIWVKRTGWGTWKSGNTNYDGIWNYYWNHNLHFTGYHTGLNQISGTGLSGYNIDFDKWYYVVTTHDNSPVANNHKVYINGQLVQTSTLGVAGYDSDGVTPKRFYVGNWDSNWSMVGEIGAYHIYQDALTEEEVFQNYNTYKTRYLNDLEEIETSGEWLKVFRQYSGTGDFFSSANDWAEAKSTNVGNPNANKYSILDRVVDYQIDGKYTFKINYPQSGITNIWSQTNNPVTDDGSGGVTGYTAISIDTTANGWGGLERYDAQTSTFLDGTLIPQSNWYYAIGSKSWSGPTTFPGPSSPVDEVELWIKYK